MRMCPAHCRYVDTTIKKGQPRALFYTANQTRAAYKDWVGHAALPRVCMSPCTWCVAAMYTHQLLLCYMRLQEAAVCAAGEDTSQPQEHPEWQDIQEGPHHLCLRALQRVPVSPLEWTLSPSRSVTR
jgi:hypothetical protein